ncbi:MAG: hypothetical protein C0493_05060 [Kytococcus sp.]|nr:hypothetical protein [Kytococcus sp.]
MTATWRGAPAYLRVVPTPAPDAPPVVVGPGWWDGGVTEQLPTVHLRPPTTKGGAVAPSLDADQTSAVGARGDVVRVLGAPGTGKTSVAVAAVLDRVAQGECAPDEVLLVAATRLAAAEARDAVTAGLSGATTEPMARTMQSLGFAVLRQHAVLAGAPAPRLLSGADQDLVLGELLDGHRESGAGPRWPEDLAEALTTRGFREELRDLLMRAIEHGVSPHDLARLGVEHDRPEWVAAAQVAREYDEVTALSRPGAFDPAWVLTASAELLEDDPEARERVRSGLRLVVVDDAHELTAPAARLLRVLTGDGVDLVLVGDPDATVQGFRGADPHHLVGDWGGRTVIDLVLRRGYRMPEAVHAAAARVTPKIAALGGGRQRAAAAARPGGSVEAHVLHSARRRRPSSPTSCAGPTCSTACRGPSWRSSCAAPRARRRCAGCSPPAGCRSWPTRTGCRCATSQRHARCSTCSPSSSTSPGGASTRSRRPTSSTCSPARSSPRTPSPSVGCVACCGGRSSLSRAPARATSCSGSWSSTPNGWPTSVRMRLRSCGSPPSSRPGGPRRRPPMTAVGGRRG